MGVSTLKVMLTGGSGQLGQALRRCMPDSIAGLSVQLITTTRTGGNDSIALDLTDKAACQGLVEAYKPDWVINAGAYTAVDTAEAEPELAYAVNAVAPGAFAKALSNTGGRLLQLSTDFVFNGDQGSPYLPDQHVNPLGVYGASKAAGETAALAELLVERLCILRTSWVYGPTGKNFLLTMLRLLEQREQLGVVVDQIGCPTSSAGLASICWDILDKGISGIHHWSDAGVASWYDFAIAIAEIGLEERLLTKAASINPINTSDYPTAARRPSYSVLCTSITRSALQARQLHWRDALRNVIRELAL